MRQTNTNIIRHWLLGRGKLIVIGPPAGLVDQTASDAPHQQTVVDGKLNDSIQIGFPLVQQCVELEGPDEKR